MQTAKKKLFLRQKRVNIRFYNLPNTINCSTMRKPFIELFTAVIDRDRITSRVIYDNKIFCTTLFWCSLKRPSVKLTKLLVRCFNVPWKSFYVNLALERLAFVAFWKLTTVTLLLHADWMMVNNASNQCGANSVTAISTRNPSRGCFSLRKLWYFGKLFGG